MTRTKLSRRNLFALGALLPFATVGCAQTYSQMPADGQKPEKKTPATIDEFKARFGEHVAQHWGHMQRIWPGMDYSRHTALAFHIADDGSIKQAWASTVDGTRDVPASELEGITPPPPGGYSHITFDGREAVMLSASDYELKTDPEALDFYKLGTHELVHFYHQSEALADEAGSTRADAYPFDRTPRLLRQMTYHNLVLALTEPQKRDEHLGHAKYWYDRWVKEFAGEYASIKSTDIAEGQARYIEHLGALVTADSSVQQMQDEVLKDVMKDEVFANAEFESYEIGYVAALLLDQLDAGWKQNFLAEKITPADRLLRDVTPQQQEVNTEVEQKLQEKIDQMNQRVGKAIKPVEEAHNKTSTPYLTIDISDTTASFARQDLVTFKGNEVATGFTTVYQTDGGQVDLKEAAVILAKNEVTVPLEKKPKVKDGKLTIKTGQVTVDGAPVTESTDSTGRTVYRIKAKA